MFPIASPLRRSPELRRAFALVLATAEDRIVQANVAETVDFLRATESDLTFENALSIFFRLVELPPRMRDAVTIHSLSTIGESEEFEEVVDSTPDEDPGAVRALARRLRGRRREGLRAEVESTAQRARARLRDAYVEGANRAVEALRDVVPPRDAVNYFIAALEIGPEWEEIIAREIVGAEWTGMPDDLGEGTEVAEDPTPELAVEGEAAPPLQPEPVQNQPPSPEGG